MESYGYIETYGYVASIVAADAALKSANVALTNCYFVKGGIVTIEITGDVAAVKAAIEAGSESAKQLGNFISNNVIARVDSETKKILIDDRAKSKEIKKVDDEKTFVLEKEVEETFEQEQEIVGNEIIEEEVLEQTTDAVIESNEKIEKVIEDEKEAVEVVQEVIEVETEKTEVEKNDVETSNEDIDVDDEKKEEKEYTKKLRKKYQDMKVTELKQKVDSLKLDYTWNQIKGMTKKKLIEILIKNNQEE